jgi:Mrp family chromosome partitioning ATPase
MNRRPEMLQDIEESLPFNVEGSAAAAPPVNGHNIRRPANDEAMRLVHQVFLPQTEGSPSVVAFAGMDHGNGCSQVASAVAEVLATDALRSVCLVEANFRSPNGTGLFGEMNGCGLADALIHKGSIRTFVRPARVRRNLWLLSCGMLAPDSPGLFASGALGERIVELRAEFDFVIIDTPPVTRYADALALGQLADGLILVVEAGVTRRSDTARAVAMLRASRIALLAAVLNKETSSNF